MDSESTAAALEAHLIRQEKPSLNSREELKTEQGKRSNIEAKKMKDSFADAGTLAGGAAIEGMANLGFGIMEQLADAVCFALKDELVDIVGGGKTRLVVRIERFFRKIFEALKDLFTSPLKLLSGLVEFVVNALSKAIGEIYALAKNLCDLVQTAWDLHRGSQTLSRADLIAKISETVLISGTMVFWDAVDPLIEANLAPVVGVAAPYLAAALTAIGFGLTSFYLRKVIPAAVAYLVDFRTGWHDALDAQRDACAQLLAVAEQEMALVTTAIEYVDSSKLFIEETRTHTEAMMQHTPIERLDIGELMGKRPRKEGEPA
jgi:hypothetical protein